MRNSHNRPKVIAIVGPTASGKSALGVFLAQKIGGEVISADSRQVYKGLNIGTGKITKKEMSGVPHHLLDVASPKKVFTVDDFAKRARKAVSMIYHTGRTPIVVGGTGFYVDTLLGKFVLPEVPPNLALRAKLEKKSVEELFTMLKKKDPARAQTIDKHNPHRLIRALEIAAKLGKSPEPKTETPYEVLWLGITFPLPALEKRITKRLRERIAQGMIAEAKRLHKEGLSYKRMETLGLEYRSLARHLAGKISKAEMEAELQQAIKNYAKRQMTWFKRNKEINWVGSKTAALRLAKEFING